MRTPPSVIVKSRYEIEITMNGMRPLRPVWLAAGRLSSAFLSMAGGSVLPAMFR